MTGPGRAGCLGRKGGHGRYNSDLTAVSMNRSRLVRQPTLAAASAVTLACSQPAGPDVAASGAVDAIPVGIAGRAAGEYEGGSVYRFLEVDCGLVLVGGSASVTAVRAVRRVAHALRIDEGDPVLRVTQVEHAQDETAVLYSQEDYVPNLFELTIRRARRARSLA